MLNATHGIEKQHPVLGVLLVSGVLILFTSKPEEESCRSIMYSRKGGGTIHSSSTWTPNRYHWKTLVDGLTTNCCAESLCPLCYELTSVIRAPHSWYQFTIKYSLR